jgi:Arc-like DNA binding domain
VARKPTDQVQLKFRVPERLRATIEKRAKKSGRSLSGEIIAMLETAIRVGDYDRLEESIRAIGESGKEYRDLFKMFEENWLIAKTPEEKAMVKSLRETIRKRMAKPEDSSRDAKPLPGQDEGDNK